VTFTDEIRKRRLEGGAFLFVMFGAWTMANGKGALACHYCRNERAGHCDYHQAALPIQSTLGNLICGNFEPNEDYWRDNNSHSPPARRFAWFGSDLKPGVLYEFHYNAPETIRELTVLREPDCQTGGWKS